jgi:lipopolysaccharide export system protein LptC
MVFRIGVGTRVDDENVKMTDLKIETFDEDGQPEMTIDLPSSQMNLSSRIIAGEESVTIKRSDFQLTGKTMEFNTETKQGWIKGDVKMIIYDLSEKSGTTESKKGGQGS